ncbi:LuxR C-terminal-related transcriptional regulator [Nocardia sp. NPDC060249]|uniref:LuxR C-terminal-related transcriptional regulator n=1 Tax=Nocardia sp. NPDC060249 TaxID=3347082 RepID=UPI0036640FDF
MTLTQRATDAGFLTAVASPSRRSADSSRVIEELLGSIGSEADSARLSPPGTVVTLRPYMKLLEAGPALLLIDNADDTDEWSLDVLRRMLLTAAPLLVVLVTTEGAPARYPDALMDLLAHPRSTTIRIGTLTDPEAEEYLDILTQHAQSDRSRAELLRLSGGNMRLMRALVEDSIGPDNIVATTTPGAQYFSAVQIYLRKLDPRAVNLAAVIATFGWDRAMSYAGRLLDDTDTRVDTMVSALSGILRPDSENGPGGFRCDGAAEAVLALAGAADTAVMHYRVAALMYESGEDPVTTATHLRAANPVNEPWAVATFVAAADALQELGDYPSAIDFLRLAIDNSSDKHFRSILHTRWSRLAWLAGPDHIKQLLHVHRSDALGSGATIGTASLLYLLWQGNFDEFTAQMPLLRSDSGAHSLTHNDFDGLRAWVGATYPSLLARMPSAVRTIAYTHANLPLPSSAKLQATKLMHSAVTGHTDAAHAIDTAEKIIQRLTFGDSRADSIEPALYSVLTLFYCDDLHRADYWSRTLLAQPVVRVSPTWFAHALALRGMVQLRLGDLPGAIENATAALDTLPRGGWGVGAGMVLGTLIEAHALAGDLDKAAEYLTVSVIPETFLTRFGLHYMAARGEYFLASGLPAAALAEFEQCGEFMCTNGLDIPGLVAWRAYGALAQVRLGDPAAARKLAQEQILRVGGAPSRSRAIALRAVAAISPPERRKRLLADAQDMFDHCGDRYGHAVVLDELAQCVRTLGEHGYARQLSRRAQKAMRECVAPPDEFLHSMLLDTPAEGLAAVPVVGNGSLLDALRTGPARSALAGGVARSVQRSPLSESESNVAELAAKGLTNREIARSLFITVSTVEQHLTRVYRKLGISKRNELTIRVLRAVCA